MKDYKDIENLKLDLPHQAQAIKEVFHSAHSVHWEDIVPTIINGANRMEILSFDELDVLKEFYEERLIQHNITPL